MATPLTMQQRLQRLLERHTLSHIAAKTGAPVSNVYTYVKKGRKVPDEFCSALVTRLGVNPAWLLTGEGSVYLADVAAGTAAMADGVFDLVQALNAITRQSLGSLLGKGQSLTLKRLDEALTAHERLREELNDRFKPVYGKLLDDFLAIMEARTELDRVPALMRAIEQISRLCDDPRLRERYESLCAGYEAVAGDHDRALTMQRDVFLRRLLSSPHADMKLLDEAGGLIHYFKLNFRLNDALDLCYTALAHFHRFRHIEFYGFLECHAASAELELGALRKALKRIQRIQAKPIWSEMRSTFQVAQIDGYFLSGGLSFNALFAIGKEEGRPEREEPRLRQELLRIACWLEDPNAVKRAFAMRNSSLGILDVYADALLRLLQARAEKGKNARTRASLPFNPDREALPRVKEAVGRAAVRIANIHLLYLQGSARQARKELIAGQHDIDAIPDECRISIFWYATHYRNVLRLVPKSEKDPVYRKLRSRAERFFQWHLKRGYNCFAEVVALESGKTPQ